MTKRRSPDFTSWPSVKFRCSRKPSIRARRSTRSSAVTRPVKLTEGRRSWTSTLTTLTAGGGAAGAWATCSGGESHPARPRRAVKALAMTSWRRARGIDSLRSGPKGLNFGEIDESRTGLQVRCPSQRPVRRARSSFWKGISHISAMMSAVAPLHFRKMNGLGNDFVVFDARSAPVAMTEARPAPSPTARPASAATS